MEKDAIRMAHQKKATCLKVAETGQCAPDSRQFLHLGPAKFSHGDLGGSGSEAPTGVTWVSPVRRPYVPLGEKWVPRNKGFHTFSKNFLLSL
ncbi:hypothetical protein ACFYZJ_33935 [Streptomyces sp. NPDC001848]|uniref:hypothetical protein n=1 Tax=Streptomyces sp. NPDC001848 TaxID=3364618 RepID=UPI00369BA406